MILNKECVHSYENETISVRMYCIFLPAGFQSLLRRHYYSWRKRLPSSISGKVVVVGKLMAGTNRKFWWRLSPRVKIMGDNNKLK